AEDLLGDAARAQVPAQRVGVRGVEEVDAALGRPVEDRERRALVGLKSERHRPQAQPGDLQAAPAQSGMLHSGTVSSPSPEPVRGWLSGGRWLQTPVSGRNEASGADLPG